MTRGTTLLPAYSYSALQKCALISGHSLHITRADGTDYRKTAASPAARNAPESIRTAVFAFFLSPVQLQWEFRKHM